MRLSRESDREDLKKRASGKRSPGRYAPRERERERERDTQALLEASHLNPHVAEPHVVRAQLLLQLGARRSRVVFFLL